MRITADATVLVRAITADHDEQSKVAQAILVDAEIVALALPVLCELVWVLVRGYRFSPEEVASVVRRLAESENVSVDRPAVEAGLALLERGGDFADGVIAYEGRWLGAELFVSFDRRATALLSEAGEAARLLA